MSSIVTAVFKATIGLLVSKGRDKAAEKLKDGDVTDQKVRTLIVREIDDIKSKLVGLSRKNLLASISFFKEGIELLYEVFDKTRPRSDFNAATTQAACAEVISIAEGMRKLELTGLDESATRALSNAKERFKEARREATRAFNNEALETSDRILAMQYRVMAIILETIDNPGDAIAPCRVCIEELHSLPAVQQCFNVEIKRGFWARLGKDQRRNIICNVCHVNFVIYTTTLMVCFEADILSNWPCVGEDKVDPLRDERITKVLHEQGIKHFSATPWSFGQEGKEEHKLEKPQGIASNSSGQFIIGDNGDSKVKVFSSNGNFIKHFSVPNDDVNTKLEIMDVATDTNDNIYVLVSLNEPWAHAWNEDYRYDDVVYVFNNTGDLHHKFTVTGGCWGDKLTVTDTRKVLVLRRGYDVVDVYKTDGQFVHSFATGTLIYACDITASIDGRVMVVGEYHFCVVILSEDGNPVNEFKLQGCYWYRWPGIAFHRASEHVVIAAIEKEKCCLHVEIYTKDGEFVRSQQIHEEREFLGGVTVTLEGRIAVAFIGTDRVLVA